MSASDPRSSIPAGYSPPFSVVTDENHTAWIIIATALGLACVLVFISARVVVRFSVSSSVGKDDWLLASSLVMTIVQSAVVLGGCSVGLGETMKHMSPQRQVQVQKIYYTGNLLWIIALGLSKISVAVLIRRIDAFGKRSNVFDVTLACISAWTIGSFFAIALKCNLSHPWILMSQKCTDVFLRWELICAFDIVTEILIFASAVYLVWELQTEFGRKATIIAGFACRLPIIVPIAFRLATFDKVGYTEDPSLRMALFTVWTQTELNYSIICATVPSLLHFMKNLNTTFGGLKDQNSATNSRRRSPYSFSKTFTRTKTKTELSQRSRRADDEEELTVFESDEAAAAAAARREERGKDSITSSNSQSLVIQKAVAYSVQYE